MRICVMYTFTQNKYKVESIMKLIIIPEDKQEGGIQSSP